MVFNHTSPTHTVSWSAALMRYIRLISAQILTKIDWYSARISLHVYCFYLAPLNHLNSCFHISFHLCIQLYTGSAVYVNKNLFCSTGRSACPYMGNWAPLINLGQCWTGRMGTVSFILTQTSSAWLLLNTASTLWVIHHSCISIHCSDLFQQISHWRWLQPPLVQLFTASSSNRIPHHVFHQNAWIRLLRWVLVDDKDPEEEKVSVSVYSSPLPSPTPLPPKKEKKDSYSMIAVSSNA